MEEVKTRSFFLLESPAAGMLMLLNALPVSAVTPKGVFRLNAWRLEAQSLDKCNVMAALEC